VQSIVSYTVSQRVELALMAFEPNTFFPRYLHSLDDVAEHRDRLRTCTYSDFAVEHLTELVWKRVNQARRKNLIYGLLAIKWILRNRNESTDPICAATVDRVFELYQHFIFDRLDAIRWCVSAMLKDKTLRPSQIQWLLDHYKTSEHIVNRLLRYPSFDPVIAEWSRHTMETNQLDGRLSELLGRLINETLPPEISQLPPPTVLWAIYYSSAELKTKQRLLEQCSSTEVADDLIEISLRLRLPAILQKFLDQQPIG